jgi:hypothetical protein
MQASLHVGLACLSSDCLNSDSFGEWQSIASHTCLPYLSQTTTQSDTQCALPLPPPIPYSLCYILPPRHRDFLVSGNLLHASLAYLPFHRTTSQLDTQCGLPPPPPLPTPHSLCSSSLALQVVHKNTKTELKCSGGLKTGLDLSLGGFLKFGGELEYLIMFFKYIFLCES